MWKPCTVSPRAQNKARRLTSTFEKSRPAPSRTRGHRCVQAGALGPRTRWRSALPHSALRDVCHPGRPSRHGDRHTPAGSVLGCHGGGACFPAPRGRTARMRTHAPPRGRVRVRLWAPCLQAAAPLGNGCREDWLQVKATWWGPGTRQAPHRWARHHFRGRCCGPPGSHGEASTEGGAQLPSPPPTGATAGGSEGRGAPCVWGPATLSRSTASPDSSGNTCRPFSSRAGQGPAPTELALSGGQSAKTAN